MEDDANPGNGVDNITFEGAESWMKEYLVSQFLSFQDSELITWVLLKLSN